GINAANLTQNCCDWPGWTNARASPGEIWISDWLAFTRKTVKNFVGVVSGTALTSFGSLMRPLVTSLPVRLSESNVSASGANPMLSIVKNVQGFLAGFGALRVGFAENSSDVLFPGSWTPAWGPPTPTLNGQGDRLPSGSVALHTTVVTPNGKLDPDAGEHMTLVPGKLSVTVGAG